MKDAIGRIFKGSAEVFLLPGLIWESEVFPAAAERLRTQFTGDRAYSPAYGDSVQYFLTFGAKALGDGWQSERLIPPEPADPEKIY